VRVLNQAIVTIPGNFFKGIAKVVAREFYEVEDPTNRQAPKVNF
jgi:LemA protein